MAADEIVMLGTGSAFPSNSYHSCFLLRSGKDSLLVDGGGGMEILRRIEQAGMPLRELHHMFVSHVHTDHIFGAVWVIRRLTQFSLEGTYSGPLSVYGNSEVIEALRQICTLTLLPAYRSQMERFVEFQTVADGDTARIGQIGLRFIDVCSRGCLQFGFVATLPGGATLGFLGDESLTERNLIRIEGCGCLISGAYCSHADREIFRPHEKHHHTVAEVAAMAQKARVGSLVLVHCEDRNPAQRQQLYRVEAAEFFSGEVRVPVDMERIPVGK